MRETDEKVDALYLPNLANETDHNIIRSKTEFRSNVPRLIEPVEHHGIVYDRFRYRLGFGCGRGVGGHGHDQVRELDEWTGFVDDHVVMGDDRNAQQLRGDYFRRAPVIRTVDVQQIDTASAEESDRSGDARGVTREPLGLVRLTPDHVLQFELLEQWTGSGPLAGSSTIGSNRVLSIRRRFEKSTRLAPPQSPALSVR